MSQARGSGMATRASSAARRGWIVAIASAAARADRSTLDVTCATTPPPRTPLCAAAELMTSCTMTPSGARWRRATRSCGVRAEERRHDGDHHVGRDPGSGRSRARRPSQLYANRLVTLGFRGT